MSSSGSLAIIAGSGAAAAGTTSKLRIADASLIGSGMSDSGNDINFLLADGQAAVVNSAGVAGLVGAAVWSLGDTILGGLHFFVEWSARQNSTVIVVGFKRASSAPTALTDLQVDSVWLQMNINASGKLNCFHKKEADTLTAQHINYDDLASAKAVIYQVAAGPLGFERRQHVSFNEAEDTQKDNANATTVLDTGGWYAFAGFGSFVTVSSDTTVAFALKGGFPV